MVMEAPPSPQCVGREFVRQYYTLLNQAPAHLHRFYNNNSSFVHGGIDTPNRETKPVIGQKQIHQKIQQLNFRDCHAKIRQVDSHATLGNGVVVQVTGELSNNGQPMRRFMQTFVLAPQSPKKYYVHNDIFRYQDEIFDDDEPEQDSGRSEAEEDAEPERPPPTDTLPHNPTVTYFNHQLPAVNGSAHPEDVAVPVISSPPAQPAPVTPVAQPPPQPQPAPAPPVVEERKEHVADEEEDVEEEEEEDPEEEKEEQENLDDTHHIESGSTEPPIKTYAAKLAGISGSSYSSTISTSPNANSVKPPASPPPTRNEVKEPSLSGSVSSGYSQPQRGPPRPRGGIRGGTRDRGPGRGGPGDDTGEWSSRRPKDSFVERNAGGDGERRRVGSSMQQYSDNHQLFMGNLPHHASEDDLKKLFGKFGTILDLRILSKQNNKGPSGNRVPNYGFIVFEDPASVQEVLNSKPIFFPDENGQKLNVEEKKTRPRQEGGRGMGSGDMIGRPSSGRGGGGGMMRGGGMGMGMSRGGRGGGMSSFSNRGEGRGGGMNRGYGRR